MSKFSVLKETFNCERKMQNVANLIKQQSSHLFVYNFALLLYGCAVAVHRVTRLGTIKNVVPGNSSSKPNQLDSERKGDEQSLNA